MGHLVYTDEEFWNNIGKPLALLNFQVSKDHFTILYRASECCYMICCLLGQSLANKVTVAWEQKQIGSRKGIGPSSFEEQENSPKHS